MKLDIYSIKEVHILYNGIDVQKIVRYNKSTENCM